MLEIDIIKPSSTLGNTVIEGFVNGKEFSVTVETGTNKIGYIALNDETVWADNHSLLEDPIVNPISDEMLAEFKYMVTAQVRTIGSRKY